MRCDPVERRVRICVHGAEASLRSALIRCGVYVHGAGTWTSRVGSRKDKSREKGLQENLNGLFKDTRRIILDSVARTAVGFTDVRRETAFPGDLCYEFSFN